jgi:hypothetical protein
MSPSWNGLVSKSGMEQLDDINSRLRPFCSLFPRLTVGSQHHLTLLGTLQCTFNCKQTMETGDTAVHFFFVKDALQKKACGKVFNINILSSEINLNTFYKLIPLSEKTHSVSIIKANFW